MDIFHNQLIRHQLIPARKLFQIPNNFSPTDGRFETQCVNSQNRKYIKVLCRPNSDFNL